MKISTSVIRFTFNCIKPFKGLIALQLVIGLIWAIDLSLTPYLTKIILDRISYSPPALVIDLLIWPAIFYIFMSLLIVIIFRLYDYLWLHLLPNLRKYIALKLMSRMIEHSHRLYQDHFAGSLANKVNDVISSIPNIIRIIIDRGFSNILAILLASYTLYTTSPKFALGLIIWSIIFIITSLKFSVNAKKLSVNTSEARSKLVGYIVDILGNMMNVRFFATKPHELSNLSNMFNNYKEAIQKRDWFIIKIHSFQGLSFVLFQGICLWLLIIGVKNQTITAGSCVLVLTINTAIVGCLYNLAHDFSNFIEDFGNIEQGLNIVLSTIEITDKPSAKRLIVSRGEIIFRDVCFQYKGATPLFNNISVSIKSGQKVGLVGYSGSGKSTFVNLILRLFDINSGHILIDNQDIRDVTQASLRKAISMIPQDASLFHRSLIENIKYGKLTASDEEVVSAVKKSHAHEFIDTLPNGYNSLVGERGIKLSGGQRQRIAIARAILKNAPILILDEATSHLDSITEQYIQESLESLMKDKTTLVVAHRLSTLLRMDRILVFDKGKIIEDGSHEKLLINNGLYKRLWDTQISGFLVDTVNV